jgi:hypothetical protein
MDHLNKTEKAKLRDTHQKEDKDKIEQEVIEQQRTNNCIYFDTLYLEAMINMVSIFKDD